MEHNPYTFQTFRVGSREFAVPQSEIATIADWRKPTPLPHAPSAVMGIVSLQGRMLTVLDLAKLIHAETNRTPQHIIALRGDEQLALAVDGIGEKIEGTVQAGSDSSGVTSGVIEHHGKLVETVNVKALFSLAIQGRERRHRRF